MSMHVSEIAILPEAERTALLEELGAQDCLQLLYDWSFWGRPDQMYPSLEKHWDNWLILAGRGWGKTRTGAETIRDWAKKGVAKRIALVAEDAGDARDVMVEGESGIINCSPPDFMPHYEPSKKRLTWPNGAVATIFSSDDPEALRGPQFDAAWVDELAKYRYAQDTWDMLQFGMRLGLHPRTIITTTPRPIPLVRQLAADPDTIVTKGTTYDNLANLAPTFKRSILKRYEGTRLGRQEIDAVILDDFPGALWTSEMLEGISDDDYPDMQRVVVAVDPSGTKGDDGHDEIGIVVAGEDVHGEYWLLADYSCSLSPAGWGRRTVEAFHEWKADVVVAEGNYGGEMVRSTILAADRNVNVKMVSATRGKVVRAEPVAALYEQGRVKHGYELTKVEDQLLAFTLTGYMGDGSPDRADAAIWALTELALDGEEYAEVIRF